MWIFEKIKTAVVSPGGGFGLLLLIWKPAEWFLGRLSDVDTITSHYGQLAPILLSPYATLVAVLFGFGLIAWAIYKTSGVSTSPVAHGTNSILSTKMPIKDFIVEAGKNGWDLESTEILDLERGVQQSALDGDLVLWGRPNVHRLPQLNKYEPLLEIPKSHWKDYKPKLLDAMNVSQNIETQTNAPRLPKTDDPNRFTDLHIGWTVAKSWLTDRGLQYRGWNKLQEDERNARN